MIDYNHIVYVVCRTSQLEQTTLYGEGGGEVYKICDVRTDKHRCPESLQYFSSYQVIDIIFPELFPLNNT